MQPQAFQPQSLTALVTTNGTTLTPSAQVVRFGVFNPVVAATDLGPGKMPGQVRAVNMSAGVVWISFTKAARVAAVPTGAAPSQEYPLQPNEDRVFTLPDGPAADGTLQINTIAVAVSSAVAVTFGEGQ